MDRGKVWPGTVQCESLKSKQDEYVMTSNRRSNHSVGHSENGASGIWPPCCCVAAYLAEALHVHGYSDIDRPWLARELGICVGPSDENPWGLPVTPESSLRGVPLSKAENRIPTVLDHFGSGLCFRHIPFRAVTLNLFPDLLEQATAQKCVAGVGFNKALLLQKPALIRHVARIVPHDRPESVVILDDSLGRPPARHIVEWSALETAVYNIDDGFWLIGSDRALDLEYAPVRD